MAYPLTQPTADEKSEILAKRSADQADRLQKIRETLALGGVVTITTYGHQWEYNAAHLDWFVASGGDLFVRRNRSKKYDCITYTKISHFRPTIL